MRKSRPSVNLPDSQREPDVLLAVLARERMIVVTGLFVLCALSWAYVLSGAGTGMSVWNMSTVAFPPPVPAIRMDMTWDLNYWLVMFVMWWVMMIAMMIPSAAPMVLLHARVARHGQARESGSTSTGAASIGSNSIGSHSIGSGAFVAGYIVAWGGFSVAATALQWGLERAGILDGMAMWSTARLLSAGLLIIAGVYQFSSLKRVCLMHCRSPAQFLADNWRVGQMGAFQMGIHHGAFCLGCCWSLMLLLFAGGVMNVFWIAGLAILVLLEKVVPFGDVLAKVIGGALVAAGLYLALV